MSADPAEQSSGHSVCFYGGCSIKENYLHVGFLAHTAITTSAYHPAAIRSSAVSGV